MHSATWPLRTVARAADVDARTLKQWFGTAVLKLRGDDRKSTGPGHHVGLSRLRAYEAAIVQHLNRHDVKVSRAAKAAYEFTLNGNNGRQAGHLFPMGKTVLVLRQADAVVSNVDPDARVSDLSNNGVSLIVDLNKVVVDVDAVLNS
jgi:hypothetical protein